ncbi:MAG: dihydrofolate reductase family protein [Candidatus Paceibacterota bacterium]|jgi:dihydrofolate reductase
MVKVFIITAITLDGFISQETTQTSMAWTSGTDKKHFIEVTKRAGVIVMGLTTFQTIGKPLPNRLNIVYAPTETPQIIGVEITQKPPKDLLLDLESRGYEEVAICGGSSIYTMFMETGLVDTIYATMEPRIFGSGIKLFNKAIDKKLSLVNITKLSDNVVLLEYKVIPL